MLSRSIIHLIFEHLILNIIIYYFLIVQLLQIYKYSNLGVCSGQRTKSHRSFLKIIGVREKRPRFHVFLNNGTITVVRRNRLQNESECRLFELSRDVTKTRQRRVDTLVDPRIQNQGVTRVSTRVRPSGYLVMSTSFFLTFFKAGRVWRVFFLTIGTP